VNFDFLEAISRKKSSAEKPWKNTWFSVAFWHTFTREVTDPLTAGGKRGKIQGVVCDLPQGLSADETFERGAVEIQEII
jgi:hypothetical protein